MCQRDRGNLQVKNPAVVFLLVVAALDQECYQMSPQKILLANPFQPLGFDLAYRGVG
jgi:hypothetical protein